MQCLTTTKWLRAAAKQKVATLPRKNFLIEKWTRWHVKVFCSRVNNQADKITHLFVKRFQKNLDILFMVLELAKIYIPTPHPRSPNLATSWSRSSVLETNCFTHAQGKQHMKNWILYQFPPISVSPTFKAKYKGFFYKVRVSKNVCGFVCQIIDALEF